MGADFEDGVRVAGGDHFSEFGLDDVGLRRGLASFVASPLASDVELDAVKAGRFWRPAAVSMAWMRYVVVDLPSVPVTPTTVSFRAGKSWKAAAISGNAARVSSTLMMAISGWASAIGCQIWRAVSLNDEGCCPVGDGVVEVLVAVDGESGDCDEGIAGLDGSRVLGDSRDDRVQ